MNSTQGSVLPLQTHGVFNEEWIPPRSRSRFITYTKADEHWLRPLGAGTIRKSLAHLFDVRLPELSIRRADVMVQSMALDGMVMLPDGSHFSLIDPDPAQINIKDIASTLARTCRFGARTRKWYSVAEHLIRCAFVGMLDGLPKDACFALLMHDSQETYVQDIPSPLKRMISDLYGPIEARVAAAVSRRFEVDFDRWAGEIHEIDKAVVLAERKALYPDYPEKWPNEDGVRVLDLKFDFCDFAEAENLFIRYFNLLKPRCVE